MGCGHQRGNTSQVSLPKLVPKTCFWREPHCSAHSQPFLGGTVRQQSIIPCTPLFSVVKWDNCRIPSPFSGDSLFPTRAMPNRLLCGEMTHRSPCSARRVFIFTMKLSEPTSRALGTTCMFLGAFHLDLFTSTTH